MALPALWPGGEPSRIAGTLLDALHEMLRLAFVFVRLMDVEGSTPTEMLRTAEPLAPHIHARDIGAVLDASLGDSLATWPPRGRAVIHGVELAVATTRLGLHGEIGVVVVGSPARNFPGQTDRLLLDVAANQAAIGLQQARLLGEQRRVARALDVRVAQRTSELAATNEALTREIAERTRAEAELRQAHDSFAEAQRLSRTGSFVADIVADDHHWSDESFRIFEFEPGTKVTVQRMRDVVHPDDLSSFDAMIARGTYGTNVTFGFRIMTERGAVKHVRGIAHVTEWSDGRPIFVGALQDVTETVVAEQSLNRARSELTRVSRVTTLSTLTASIAHEVNQPLSAIITNASTCLRMLAAESPDVDGARETAKRTLRDGNRTADIVARLRALFGNQELTLESLDLNEATREVVALSLSELQQHRVVLLVELADELPLVTGDRIQLQQVLLNLIRNASDAMDGVEDRPRELLINTQRDGEDRVRVTVRDAGVGIEGGQSIDALFDAFYTTKSDGMGIGLSVSRSIIEQHQGRIWAVRNDGPGATFGFSIPCRPRHASATAVDVGDLPSSGQPQAPRRYEGLIDAPPRAHG